MRTVLFHLSVIAMVFLISPFQSIGADAKSQAVSPADRLSIAEPRSSGQWKSNDIVVEYSYSKDQGQIDLSGKVLFATYFLGYSRLQDFRIGAVFLDENGKVLDRTGLTSTRGAFDPVPFHTKVKLPPNAVFMVFTYQGNALPSGQSGGGTTSFSFYPVR